MKKTSRYTITEIAKELGVTRQTIYYWIKKKWVMPKRDYRNYPIFSDKDVKSIKKWHRTLKNAVALTEHNNAMSSPTKPTRITAPLTWEEIQKTLYK